MDNTAPYNTYLIPTNGRLIRNIIHGMDTVMSHITHFYHLSAPDFINFSTGLVNMSPWTPSYTTSDLIAGSSVLGQALIVNYVTALKMRRLAHTASALFSGRHPIQNAIIPGGVSTLTSTTYPNPYQVGTDYDAWGPFNLTETKTKFTNILNQIRDFIDNTYIPNVVTVATSTTPNFVSFWTQGFGCGNFLSYGDFPMNATGNVLLIKRGIATSASTSVGAFDQANIVEHVGNSWYDYPALDAVLKTNGRHPFDGVTVPNMKSSADAQYSWLKAPRYGTAAQVLEVGPLARMFVSYLSSDTGQTVTNTFMTNFGISGGSPYSVRTLINAVMGGTGGGLNRPVSDLISTLGRHAARALEAKLLADACAVWNGALVDNGQAFTYKKISKMISTGVGLCEAPRGALGHWIKIEGRKVAKYQCVVPSTWNFSPKDNNGTSGPVEQSLVGSYIGTTDEEKVLNILRLVHPFDCCIACAVHVVGPDGKEKLKFAIGPDGRPANIEKVE
ncbi:MAG: nickel-dependent hydrogenase large subunit [Nitrospirota bacterium]